MKTIAMALTLASGLFLAATALAADDQQPVEKKSAPTQSQLALDHGPHAAVTPAVKRKRQESAKAVAAPAASK